MGLDADSHPFGHLVYGKVTLQSVMTMPWGLGSTSAYRTGPDAETGNAAHIPRGSGEVNDSRIVFLGRTWQAQKPDPGRLAWPERKWGRAALVQGVRESARCGWARCRGCPASPRRACHLGPAPWGWEEEREAESESRPSVKPQTGPRPSAECRGGGKALLDQPKKHR